MPDSVSEQLAGTPLLAASADYLEALYEQYLLRPDSVDPAWRAYFSSVPPLKAVAANEKQAAVSRLMQIYSNRGHLIAHIDPLGLLQRPRPRVLDLDYAGLERAPISTPSSTPAAATTGSPSARRCARSSRGSSTSTAATSAPSSRTSRTPTSACGCRTNSSSDACSSASAPRSGAICSAS